MAMSRMLGLCVALRLLAGVAGAHPRELELSRIDEHPYFAGFGGLSGYNPDSSPAGTSVQLSAGVRYVKPYEQDATYDFSATQFSVARTIEHHEHLTTYQLDFFNFLPRTQLFTFDHHFFYGAGIGTVMVERSGLEELALPVATLSAGLQSRVKRFDIESSIKLVVGPQRHVYDASGTVAQVALVYPLGY